MSFPADIELELGAVAAVIDAAGDGAPLLEADLFTDPTAGRVAEVVRGMVAGKIPVSFDTVQRTAGPDASTVMAAGGCPGLAFALPFLREKRALRHMLALGERITGEAGRMDGVRTSVTAELQAFIHETTGMLAGVAAGLDSGVRLTGKDLALELIDALEAADRGERPPTIPTGILGIDGALGGGLRGREMAVLGARTSVGKSALACWITKEACMAGKRVLYASREMRRADLLARIVSARSGVPVRIHEGKHGIGQQGLPAVTAALAAVKGWQLFIRDDLRTIAAVRAETSAIKPDLVVVDHVGIFDAQLQRKTATATDAATANSNALRDLAFDSGAAVLCLAQVNRAGADSDEPQLHHLKQSGALEEDARAVLLMHRVEELIDGGQHIGLNLAKNTSGPLRTVTLRFDPDRCSFKEQRPTPDHHAR